MQIEHILRFTGRIRGIVAVISHYSYHVVAFSVYDVSYVGHHGQIPSIMPGHFLSVYPHSGFTHYCLEMQKQFFV